MSLRSKISGRFTKPWISSRCASGSISGMPLWLRSKWSPLGVMVPFSRCKGVQAAPAPGAFGGLVAVRTIPASNFDGLTVPDKEAIQGFCSSPAPTMPKAARSLSWLAQTRQPRLLSPRSRCTGGKLAAGAAPHPPPYPIEFPSCVIASLTQDFLDAGFADNGRGRRPAASRIARQGRSYPYLG